VASNLPAGHAAASAPTNGAACMWCMCARVVSLPTNNTTTRQHINTTTQQNNKTTKQQNNKTTKQQNNKKSQVWFISGSSVQHRTQPMRT
jgi:hypothetical protein